MLCTSNITGIRRALNKSKPLITQFIVCLHSRSVSLGYPCPAERSLQMVDLTRGKKKLVSKETVVPRQ